MRMETSILGSEIEDLQAYFKKYRDHIIGIDHMMDTPLGHQLPILYADWIASGRMYGPIEAMFQKEIYPLVANTHTDTNTTGMSMTYAYHKAQKLIKEHVGANQDDVIICCSSGMTGSVNKLQRILGLKIHECYRSQLKMTTVEKPVVFVSHMEHHSNQTSWFETIADVIVVPPCKEGLVDPMQFDAIVQTYKDRKVKIAAITSCSNVTGIMTPYLEVAEIMHKHEGLCFVDFACSAPYVDIDMHPDDKAGRYLDAIYFSPHKFLGGPGSPGVLVFNKSLYKNEVPDHPGGGTVDWTNPWGGHKYIDDVEAREDGGTPPFLQTIRTAFACMLKDQMGTQHIQDREHQLLEILWPYLDAVPNLHILASQHRNRLGAVSFYIDGLHYNLGVKILNDRFGIQTRGGCSCAGTYGHYLLNVTEDLSKSITDQISSGDCSSKPGWIRLSIHPTHTDEEVHYMGRCIRQLAQSFQQWVKDYDCDYRTGRFRHRSSETIQHIEAHLDQCFSQPF